jgi:hypothetical protein
MSYAPEGETNMAIHEDLAVQYHQQDTNYYCGAACAQMVLSQAEVGAGLLDQDALYADNHSHSTTEGGWYTAPDGLTWTLNDRRPASFGGVFVLFALANEDLISRKICWTIHHYHVAPVAMVFGSAHWIVVRGYEAGAAPLSSADNSYTITAFDVNNPWPPTPSPAPPPPHTAGDVCGSGGDRGVADEHITYATWQADYMTGIGGGYWAGKFVAVCDPEPPPDRAGQQSRPWERLSGERLISRAVAVRRAETGLREYGLYERETWREALQNTNPGGPVLVQRLDQMDRYYYIVPMQATQNRVPVLVSVDARFGDYRQAVALPNRGSHLVPNLGRRELIEQVVGNRFELEDRLGRLIVRREALCLYPTLVWKPCRESLSPFWPFYMITVGAHQLYVRLDGAVFTKLHDDERGI